MSDSKIIRKIIKPDGTVKIYEYYNKNYLMKHIEKQGYTSCDNCSATVRVRNLNIHKKTKKCINHHNKKIVSK